VEFKIARLDKLATTLTIFVTILLVGLSIFFILKVPHGWIFAILMLSIVFVSYLLSPVKYYFLGSKLVIQKVIGKKIIIPLEEVRGYVVIPDFAKLRVARTLGNGGLFGYYGMFSTAEYGTINCQLRNLKEIFIIKTACGMFAISPADRLKFEEYLVNAVRGLKGTIETLVPSMPRATEHAHPLILILPIVIFICTTAMVLFLYPGLPERMAVHFDMHGTPDGWASRSSFIISGLIPATVLFAISVIIFLFVRRATRKPALPYLIVVIFAFFQLFAAYVSLDTYWINKKDAHLVPFPYNIIGYVLIIAVLLYVYYRRIKGSN